MRALNRALVARQHLLDRVELPIVDMVEHLVGLQAFLRPLMQPAIERNHKGAFGRRMGDVQVDAATVLDLLQAGPRTAREVAREIGGDEEAVANAVRASSASTTTSCSATPTAAGSSRPTSRGAMLAHGRFVNNVLVDGMLRATWWPEDGVLAIRPFGTIPYDEVEAEARAMAAFAGADDVRFEPALP